MKIIKRSFKKETEYVLVPEIYYRPYIEKSKDKTSLNCQTLFCEVEKISWEMLQDLYNLLLKKNRTFEDNQIINLLAKDLIMLSYGHYLEEFALHVWYLMKKYNKDSFVNFVFAIRKKDKYFAEIMNKVFQYAVLHTEKKVSAI